MIKDSADASIVVTRRATATTPTDCFTNGLEGDRLSRRCSQSREAMFGENLFDVLNVFTVVLIHS